MKIEAESILNLIEEAEKISANAAEALWNTANEIFRQLPDKEKPAGALYLSDLFILIEEKKKKEKLG